MDNSPKERIKFKNQRVFGRLFDPFIDSAISFVGKMYISGKIEPNGKVNDTKKLLLGDLWSYVYYLYYYNRDKDPFKSMKTLTGNHASARNFYKIVHKITKTSVGKINEKILIKFINIVITEYKINNPIQSKSIIVNNKDCEIEKRKLEDEKNKLEDEKNKLEDEKSKLEDEIYSLTQLLNSAAAANKKQTRKKSILIKDNCDQELLEFKELCKNFEKLIISKLCLLKYLGNIMHMIPTLDIKCDESNITDQIKAFDKLHPKIKFNFKTLYHKNRNDILKLKTTYSDLINIHLTCGNLVLYKKQYNEDLIKLDIILGELLDIYEDLYGKVRCYIKVRKFIKSFDKTTNLPKIKVTNNKEITLECSNKEKISGNFFGVFDKEYTNADLYSGVTNTKTNGLNIDITDIKSWSLSKTFDQLKRNYSISLLNMGFSGSGKSYTLFGDQNEPGLINYALSNLGIKSHIEYVFELYYDEININAKEISGKVIIVYDRPKDLNIQLKRYGIDNYEYENLLKLDDLDIQDAIKLINMNQLKNGRIKKTFNNPNSSRSHLFIVLKVGTSYLNIVDLAGIENAFQIYTLFNNKMSMPYFLLQFDSKGIFKGQMKNEKISKYITGNDIKNTDTILEKNDVGKLIGTSIIEDTLQKNVQILLESFYIVETLNHIQYYFNKEEIFEFQAINAGTIQYKTSRVFVDPIKEKQKLYKKQIYIIPILDFLNDLGSKDTLSKFILLGYLRPDQCEENIQTLKYLKKLN
jgi:hypothetical protein